MTVESSTAARSACSGRWYDNTERKRCRGSLRESEAYLTEAQRLSHTGSWALDVASNRYPIRQRNSTAFSDSIRTGKT